MILPDLPFESDECSGPLNWFWKLLYRQDEPPWCQCCVAHDFAYWQGGTAVQRATADADLMACITENGHPWFAILVWLGVRIGGMPHMPWGWTWGWGWTTPRGYAPRPQDPQERIYENLAARL